MPVFLSASIGCRPMRSWGSKWGGGSVLEVCAWKRQASPSWGQTLGPVSLANSSRAGLPCTLKKLPESCCLPFWEPSKPTTRESWMKGQDTCDTPSPRATPSQAVWPLRPPAPTLPSCLVHRSLCHAFEPGDRCLARLRKWGTDHYWSVKTESVSPMGLERSLSFHLFTPPLIHSFRKALIKCHWPGGWQISGTWFLPRQCSPPSQANPW